MTSFTATASTDLFQRPCIRTGEHGRRWTVAEYDESQRRAPKEWGMPPLSGLETRGEYYVAWATYITDRRAFDAQLAQLLGLK